MTERKIKGRVVQLTTAQRRELARRARLHNRTQRAELDEILALADRVVVMNAGRITGELSIDECDERRLGLLMAAQEERVAA